MTSFDQCGSASARRKVENLLLNEGVNLLIL